MDAATTLDDAARARVAHLPYGATDPSDFTSRGSIRSQVAELFDDLYDVRSNIEDTIADGDHGEHPGFEAVAYKLAEAHGAVLSALQAARQAQPDR